MKKTLIGVLPLVDPERNSFWMHPGYLHGIEQAGGLPVVLPMTMEEASLKQMVETMDGFLFTSGQDVSPELYGEAKGPHCGQCLPQRDEMEIKLLEMVLGADKPMLGICRGLQLLNVAMGGKLYQHLSTERPSDIEHFQSPPYDVPTHKVRVGIGSPLHWGLGVEELNVTSYHHQGIRELAPSLTPMAWAEDGLVEAACLPTVRFAWAVQWNPELTYQTDEDSRDLFKALVKAAGERL